MSAHIHTHAQKHIFCTHGKMKTSVGVILKFVSVFWAQAKKKDLLAHYFDCDLVPEIEKKWRKEEEKHRTLWTTKNCRIWDSSHCSIIQCLTQPWTKNPQLFFQLLLEMHLYTIFSPNPKHHQSIKISQKQFQLCVCVSTQTSATWMNFEMSLQRSSIWHNSDSNERTCSVVVSH